MKYKCGFETTMVDKRVTQILSKTDNAFGQLHINPLPPPRSLTTSLYYISVNVRVQFAVVRTLHNPMT